MSSLSVSNNIEIEYDGTDYIYNSTIINTPIVIINLGSNQITVKLNFYGNISNVNDYITIGTNNITIDGQNIPININVANYGGLIRNNSDSYYNIIIQNVHINTIGSGSLANNAGWICSGFTTNLLDNIVCTAINCSSNGNITTTNIINAKGGIFGSGTINCVATNCYSTGNINNGGGGIFGQKCGNCTANNCYSTGNIINASGGIFGFATNYQGNNYISNAINCFSTGNIDSDNRESGGIFGYNSNLSASNSQIYAENCYSTGSIGGKDSSGNGGIFSGSCNAFSIINCTCYANNCSSYGNIYGDITSISNGGIFGIGAENCEANNCFSIGEIGMYSGGIFLTATNCNAYNCYTIGKIGECGGGIYGRNISQCNALYCYSTGNISDSAGGIYGYLTDYSNAIQCYSIGSLGINSGGIFGINCTSPISNRCYILGANIFGNNATDPVSTNSYSENNIWNDINALNILNDYDNWFSYTTNTPFLLSSYDNNINIPIGYKYTYILPDIITYTTRQDVTLIIIIGFYSNQQTYSDIIGNNIYGYSFNTNNLNINGGGIPNYFPILFKLIKNTSL
jgi:hypothetical protein